MERHPARLKISFRAQVEEEPERSFCSVHLVHKKASTGSDRTIAF